MRVVFARQLHSKNNVPVFLFGPRRENLNLNVVLESKALYESNSTNTLQHFQQVP